MSIEKRLIGVNPSGDKPNVEDVFSTYLWEGNDGAQTIANGVDLLNEGGLVWFKNRTTSNLEHMLVDTERGLVGGGNGPADAYYLMSDETNAQSDRAYAWSFLDNGFSFNKDYSDINQTGESYVSWTFRKAPKFFDVKTFIAESDQFVTVNHDLGCNIGAVMYKETSGTGDWYFWHKSFSENDIIRLNTTAAKQTGQGYISSQTSSSARFYTDANTTSTYVAYFFGDGEDDDGMIACGSYTGNGSDDGPEINLGWEAQYVLVKSSSASANWIVFDSMRSMSLTERTQIYPNTSDAEYVEGGGNAGIHATSTGFKVGRSNSWFNSNGGTYIYMAIRAPMMKEPEDATDVFAMDTGGSSSGGNASFTSGFPVDLAIYTQTTSSNNEIVSRLNSTRLYTNSTNAENSTNKSDTLAFMDGYGDGTYASDYIAWMWKRAKGYFDAVAYQGSGTDSRTLSHSLGVAPEMMWVKRRGATGEWKVYHHDLGNDKEMVLNGSGSVSNSDVWDSTTPTDSQFTVYYNFVLNISGEDYIAYLFASLDGISKVGSYTGNGSSQTIDCGFSNGARFVLIKRTDASGDWMLWDSVRGLSASGGEATYTSVGTHNWTAPAGVTSVSVVAVGGGGAGGVASAGVGGGGGGGSLSYKNNIPVTAGNTYSVCVGGGGAVTNASVAGGSGGDSYFINNTTLLASGGGGGGGGQSGAGYAGTGGVLSQYSDGGGAGGNGASHSTFDSGGGGAGGYSGKGGDGKATSNGKAGNGGAGGGGSRQRGGGVGLYGEGASGASSSGQGNAGSNGNGGSYGAGGSSWAVGYQGAVRIIWSGSSRSFPSTGTGSADEPSLPLNTTSAETSSDSIDSNSLGFDIKQDATTNANVSSATYIYLAIA